MSSPRSACSRPRLTPSRRRSRATAPLREREPRPARIGQFRRPDFLDRSRARSRRCSDELRGAERGPDARARRAGRQPKPQRHEFSASAEPHSTPARRVRHGLSFEPATIVRARQRAIARRALGQSRASRARRHRRPRSLQYPSARSPVRRQTLRGMPLPALRMPARRAS